VPRMRAGSVVVLLALLAPLAACGTSETDGRSDAGDGATVRHLGSAPERFTIRPDDYHVPYAGTAADGRKFFLSQELFHGQSSYVGLFLWKADGTFDSVQAAAVRKPSDAPIGQAVPAGAQELVDAYLAQLGGYTLEPITVEPFTKRVDGVRFGWRASQYDGSWSINIEPGDFIAYYAPWDGAEYDT
jgi:hypothetical protein